MDFLITIPGLSIENRFLHVPAAQDLKNAAQDLKSCAA
jgi:hypothetical protein